MALEFSRQIFEKFSNTKFHASLSSGSRVVRTDGRTDEGMKLVVAFRNFANAPKKQGDIIKSTEFTKKKSQVISINQLNLKGAWEISRLQ